MPELPDVEVFKQYFDPTSLHQKVKDVEVLRKRIVEGSTASELRSALKGRTFESTTRYAKYLFAKLDDGRWLVFHFGMTGFFKYFKRMEKEPPHDRLLFTFENGYHLAYDCQRLLGEVRVIEKFDEFLQEKHLGPDVLDRDFDFTAFKEVFAGRRGMVKSALMNQQILSGVGNVYSDEILFHAGIHPKTTINQLDQDALKKLYRNMRDVLKAVIQNRADPDKMPSSFFLPHRKEGGRCPECDGEIEKIKVSGRTAYYCPNCQRK